MFVKIFFAGLINSNRLIDAGKTIDINVLDHVIVGRKEWGSWLEDKKVNLL